MGEPAEFLDIAMGEDEAVFPDTYFLSKAPVPSSLNMPPGPPVNAGFQVSACPSSSSCVGSSGPTFPSPQVRHAGPRKQRKERTVYTKEQKLLLQERFKKCMYPSLDQRKELAAIVGVTEKEIKIWFKNNRARYRRNEPPNVQDDNQRN